MPFDAASNNRVNPGTSLTQAHTCTGSNRALVAAVIGEAAADRITGATYAGNAMTLVAKGQASGGRWVYLFYLSAPPAGTANIVVSASASSYIECDAASYTGVTQTGQPNVFVAMTGASSGASWSTNLTTTVANSRVVIAALGQSGTITAGAGTTLRATNLVGALLDSGTTVAVPGLVTLVHNQATSGNPIGSIGLAFEEGGAPTNTITLTDVVERRVIQRNGTTGSITISGTHSGATSVQARVVQHGTSTEVLGWTTIDAAPGGSTWSGALNVIPQGGWYNIQVRQGNSTGTVANGANRFGVGILVAPIGQSQMRNWFDNGTSVTPDDRLVQYSGSNGTGWAARTTTGNGANTFGNAMVAALGGNIPVALLRYAIGATSLLQVADAGNGWWLNTAGGSPYALFKAGVDSIGGKLEAVAWAQGEQDGFSNAVSQSDYATALATLCARIRTDFAQPTLPIVIVPLGRYTNAGPTDASWQGIQSALATVGGQANNTLSSTVLDLALADGVHFTDAAYSTHATRAARAMRAALGLSSYASGPAITGAVLVNSTTVQVNLAHGGGTDFTPSSAITGFEVLDNGAAATISTAVRTSATAITLTVSAAMTGPVTVRHLYGRNPVISNRVLDNTTEALPLRSIASIAAIVVYRPGADVSGSWTPVGAGSVAAALADESTSNWGQSPDLSASQTLSWTPNLPAGTWDIPIVADRTGASGQTRIVCLDAGGASVGASAWQALTATQASYTLSVTTTATATQFRIEVQP